MPKFFKGSDFQGLNAPSFFCFNFAGAGATGVRDAFAICVFVCVFWAYVHKVHQQLEEIHVFSCRSYFLRVLVCTCVCVFVCVECERETDRERERERERERLTATHTTHTHNNNKPHTHTHTHTHSREEKKYQGLRQKDQRSMGDKFLILRIWWSEQKFLLLALIILMSVNSQSLPTAVGAETGMVPHPSRYA